MKLLMSTKAQFKMYLDEDLIERLRHVAKKSGKDSGQEVAEEVLKVYLPVWSTVQQETTRALEYQTKLIVEADGAASATEIRAGQGDVPETFLTYSAPIDDSERPAKGGKTQTVPVLKEKAK